MTIIANYLASRNLPLDTAAEKAGMSRERFEDVLAGADATLGEMRGIAKALKVPLSALLESRPAEPVKMLFRHTLEQRAVNINPQVDIVSAQIRDALAIARSFPSSLTWLNVFDGLRPSLGNVDEFALRFRKAFAQLDDIEPFPQLPQIVNELGIFILFCRDSTIEGVSAIVDGYAFVILGARGFKPRLLFTLAHELGHLVAHHDNRVNDYAHLDEEVDSLKTPRKEAEKFADAFASSLMMPSHGVLLALKAVRDQLGIKKQPLGTIEIAWIAHLFHVSFEVAARRFETLGLLPRSGARAFYQKLQDEYKNPERFSESIDIPARPEISIETSPLLMEAAVQKIRSGDLSIGRASELLNVPVSALFVANAEIGA